MVSNLEMSNFFDEQGRTRVLARGVLLVRRGLKPAENAAHRKKGHFPMETIAVRTPQPPARLAVFH